MKYEWRKEEKSLYGVKASPKVVDVPEQSFIFHNEHLVFLP